MPRTRKDALIGLHSKELRRNPTNAEDKLWAELRSHRFEGVHFRRQHPIGNFIVDFCAPNQRLIIKLDGGQHLDQAGYDAARTRILESMGYRVLRFWNDTVFKDLVGVMNVIYDEMKKSEPE